MITMGNLNENGAKFFGMGASNSGGGGGEFRVIGESTDGVTITVDKTVEEIKSAYDSGMNVTCLAMSEIYRLTKLNENAATFSNWAMFDDLLTIIEIWVWADGTTELRMGSVNMNNK